jgi:RNA polymerase sigma-70 factor (ECF subfamily)
MVGLPSEPGDVPLETGGTRIGGVTADIDDTTLVVRAQQGDLRALEVLLRRHEKRMYRLALRLLNNPRDAEEAVQEAYLSAWRRLGSFRGDSLFSSWLYRIVSNRCLNMIRARQPNTSLDPSHDVRDVDPRGDPERSAEFNDDLENLRRAVAALPAEQRICWVLRENDALGYEEIADIVGTSPDAVRGRIHRARVNLAKAMRP